MYGFGAVSLRYFNVAGAFRDAAGTWLGERHTVETHLIPNILRIARDDSGPVSIFGDDYPTAGRKLHPGLHPRRPISQTRTCWRSTRASPASTRSTTSAAGLATPTSRCSRRAGR